MLGKLQPNANAPKLLRLQHLAAADQAFALLMAKDIV